MKNTYPVVSQIKRNAVSKTFFSAAFATLLASTSFAAPVNDNLGQATVISSTLPVTVTGSNIDATAQAGEPNHSDTEAAGGKSIWWSWVSPINGTVVVSTHGSGIADAAAENGYRDTVDTQVGIYTTTGGIGGLTLVARKEDSDGLFAKGWTYLTFTAVQGTTYKIAVDGWDGQTGPVIKLNLSTDAITPPPPAGYGLTINITPATAGDVTVSPLAPAGGYADGTVVTLTATPATTNVFSAWGGAANGSSNSVTVTMNGNKTVNAIFNANNEILVQSVDKRIGAWLFQGSSFLGGSLLRNGIALNGWRVVGTADYNDDSKRDVVLQHPDGRISVWMMNGTTFLSNTPIGTAPANLQARAVADFDNNGSPDIAFQNTDDSSVVIWTYTNNTTFSSAVAVRGGKPATSRRLIGAANVNAAGGPDLVFAVADGRIAAWTLNGTTFSSAIPLASSRAAGAAWTAVGVFDMDGNGSQDILFQNADGRSAVWFQNGTAFSSAIVLRNGQTVAPGAKLVSAN